MKVTMGAIKPRNVDPASTEAASMSYAEAKEIAVLRLELRGCWDSGDLAGANTALARLWQIVGSDQELTAEARRWSSRLGTDRAA